MAPFGKSSIWHPKSTAPLPRGRGRPCGLLLLPLSDLVPVPERNTAEIRQTHPNSHDMRKNLNLKALEIRNWRRRAGHANKDACAVAAIATQDKRVPVPALASAVTLAIRMWPCLFWVWWVFCVWPTKCMWDTRQGSPPNGGLFDDVSLTSLWSPKSWYPTRFGLI